MKQHLAYLNEWRLFLQKRALTQLQKLYKPTSLTQLAKLNLEKRYRVNIGRPTRINLLLVGCGGTGSFAAHTLAQFAAWGGGEGLDVRLVFIDPDSVEPKNLVRQNFCQAEVGYPKAFTLAWRYTAAFGLKITPVVARFSATILEQHSPLYAPDHSLTVVIGAVDNVAARRDIAAAVTRQLEHRTACWWIDSGNERDSGQVLAGGSLAPEPLLSPLGYCTALPLPHLQEPGLLAERDRPDIDLSCAELGLLAEQSAMINRTMATWLGVYLYRLLQSRDLDMMATWVDLAGGSVRSIPISGGRWVKPEKPRRIPVRVAALPTPAAPETPVCPECGEAHLVEGVNDYYGAIIAVRFCDHCTYRVEGCPDCWGELEESTRRDDRGQPVPVIRCLECHWNGDLTRDIPLEEGGDVDA
jgi:PRTRC genetic system ThiF family protein